MKKRVALIEFPLYDQYPLVGGYLQTYAQADPAIAESFEFVHLQKDVESVKYPEILSAVRALEADMVCFSCYVWNSGLIKRLVMDLRQDPKVEKVILGGHQISHHIGEYIPSTDRKTVVINGQGEIPFRAAMQRLAGGGELWGMKGVSLYGADNQLWNGGEAEMLTTLDEIPSPFLGGVFDRMAHPITTFETNRGCPYKCTFCTWGGDTLKVTKFSLERIKEELLWLAKRRVLFIYIADANWGMLARDVELSEYISKLKKDHGYPWIIQYAAAKNKPKGSIACIEKLHEGGVITAQALGIQSMNENTLSLIDRTNIKTSAFVEMFEQLRARNIDSYCELIWPLPGETLDTLKTGVGQLIELGARTIIMYPAILINNARLTEQAAEFEIESVGADDWKSELKLVKQTKFVDRQGVDAGFWFYYSLFLLSNCDAQKSLLRYLREATGKSYEAIIGVFADYLQNEGHNSAYSQFIRSVFQSEAHGSVLTIGKVAAHLTHEGRLSTQTEIANCLVTKLLVGDINRSMALSCLFNFSLPRLFSDTRDDPERVVAQMDELGRAHGKSLSTLARVRSDGRGNVVINMCDALDVWREMTPFFSGAPSSDKMLHVEISHPKGLVPYNQKDITRNYVYANGMIERIGHVSACITVH